MKNLIFLTLLALPLCATPENPLVPDTWFHDLTATDGSTQQCVIFTTIPGVEYTFFHSHDLGDWTEVGKTYGLGHEFAAAMRETAPAPPPPDPENPPEPADPLQLASIVIQPSSATEGGTVVSWVSLEHGNSVQYLITGNMVMDWYSVPMFAENHGTHHFFISHPPGTVAPPEGNPVLDNKDAAMIADLEAAWSAFNTAVTSAVETARNTPPPPPPAIDAKGFWRIKADWSLDSDGDGSTDADEFALAAEGPDGNGLVGNPFNADTDGDGNPDGGQLDSDGDGTPDAVDTAKDDGLIAYEIIGQPRYAVFETGGYGFQINDHGTVLFLDRTWKGGTTTPLVTAGNGLSGGTAVSLNNNDEILGLASRTVAKGTSGQNYSWSSAAFWAAPSDAPVPVQAGTNYPYGIWVNGEDGFNHPAPILSDDRRFFGASFTVVGDDIESDSENKLWTIAAGGASASLAALDPEKQGMTNIASSNLYWGLEPDSGHPGKGRVFAPGALPLLPEVPLNVIPHTIPKDGSTAYIATFRNPEVISRIHHGGDWEGSILLADALDMAADGTAIGRTIPANALNPAIPAPVLLNGKWTPMKRAAPAESTHWIAAADTLLIDTSPAGWILAWNALDEKTAALLPLRVKGGYENSPNEAVGVDDYSILSDYPDAIGNDTFSGPAPPVRERIWIMAPLGGGAKPVTFDAPVTEDADIEISAPGILFDESGTTALESTGQTVDISADLAEAETGDEIDMIVKAGAASSVSSPVAFKVMKDRTLLVTVYRVGQSGSPVILPVNVNTTALDLYLNGLYGPQINLNVISRLVNVPDTVDWDENNDKFLDVSVQGLTDEQELITGLPAVANDTVPWHVQVFVVGMPEDHFVDRGGSFGFTHRDSRSCWITGSTLFHANNAVLNMTIAHEIGHVLVGGGHPNLPTAKGPAPLPGIPKHLVEKRLMYSGLQNAKRRLLVKAEWDEAEDWSQQFVDP